ncbi:hypothetical protein [Micromonospora lupini]|uniref:Uncharacterized protein n=1 Tax=Micromonospora lupini str. Lupac 08 TaxID=1150864 RepID=I0LEM8_9ACTN|nr:hypothetical protein [Micromonospora lupini]CCH22275.1 hypothetical protein MILUP08_40156 [Micromonospora lupini str. Lupac 08]
MDELTEQFRAIVAGSPPTRIDLDALIAADRQRRRHRVWTLTGTGVAAAVATIAVVPTLVAGPGAGPGGLTLPSVGSGPSGSASLCAVPNPSASGPEPPLQTYDTVRVRPTERPDVGVPRLTTALRVALAATVPTNLMVTGTVPECDQPQFTYQAPYRSYTTIATLTRDGQRSHLDVSLRPTSVDAQADCAEAPDSRNCEVRGLGDDGVAMLSTSTDPAGGILRWVQLLRVDGTSVTVRAGNLLYGKDGAPESTAPEALLTSQELVELARAPGLTLYP